MKCYSCGKEERVRRKGGDLVSDIDRVEVEMGEGGLRDEEERYMPLCQKCVRKYMAGRLRGIDRKWREEPRRFTFIDLHPDELFESLSPSGWTCPKCGVKETLPVAYGFPTVRVEEEARKGRLILGGCDPTSRSRRCRSCGHSWEG